MIENLENKALILDLDGVVSWRIPVQKTGVPIIGHHNPDRYTKPVKEVLPSGEPSVYSMNTMSIFSALRHFFAPVFPDVINVIKSIPSDVCIYGNTGRKNELPMIYFTSLSLGIAGISDKFEQIYFKPKGHKTLEHKLAVSRMIAKKHGEENMIVADDNPYDLIPQARQLQRAKFLLIKDLTTDKLTRGINMAKEYPNVLICNTLRQGLKSIVVENFLPVQKPF